VTAKRANYEVKSTIKKLGDQLNGLQRAGERKCARSRAKWAHEGKLAARRRCGGRLGRHDGRIHDQRELDGGQPHRQGAQTSAEVTNTAVARGDMSKKINSGTVTGGMHGVEGAPSKRGLVDQR